MIVRQTGGSGVANFLVMLGGALVVFGAVLLLALGFIALDAVRSPESVGIVQHLLTATAEGKQAVAGSVGELQFALTLDEPVSTVIFVFLGFWVLGMMASIITRIIEAGRALMSAATDWRSDENV
ncbi:MAG: hypothetical protein AAF458_13855 [Pseudomonadota bacterium]